MAAPIVSAKNLPLLQTPGSLPNMSGTLTDWFQPLVFSRVTKEIIDYRVVETLTEVQAMGVRQPLSAQELQVKPESQRAWKWEQIHAWPDTPLQVDEIIAFNGIKYRVMEKWDWTEYGYLQFHILLGSGDNS